MDHGRKTKGILSGSGTLLACALLVAGVGAVPAQASAAAVNCGDTLTADAALTADLVCAGGGLTIATDGVTLDLGGHVLTATGLTLRASGVTVKNGKIVGTGGEAVTVQPGTTGGTVEATLSDVQVTAGATRVQDATLTVAGSNPALCLLTGLTVLKSTATVEQCVVHGEVSVQDSPEVTVASSTLSEGRLTTARSGGVYNGTVFDSFPVTVAADAGEDVFQDNLFRNADTALEVKGGQRTTFDGNVFMNNSVGLLSTGGFALTTVKNNVFHSNKTVGLLVNQNLAGVNPDPVADNIFFANGMTPRKLTDLGGNTVRGGLHLFTGTLTQAALTVARNGGLANGGFLIWARPGSVTDGGGNRGPCGPKPKSGLTCA
ncbi:right-handed parallel beta-helix repeat-containing protein [Streptosporangium sp. NPDC000239]|uniref:right-handed parallel beta-helix repeat-containing protein n=1 Tax=Streptosporangium sp. NPDC000239 TaxID=3154248 RepID=UPI0033221BC8